CAHAPLPRLTGGWEQCGHTRRDLRSCPFGTRGHFGYPNFLRMTEPGRPFLDVPTLLETSQPRGAGLRGWQVLGMFMLIVLVSAWASGRGDSGARAVNVLSAVVMLGVVGGMMLLSWSMFRRARAEQMRLESAEELIRLRRWPEAAMVLNDLLGQPTR